MIYTQESLTDNLMEGSEGILNSLESVKAPLPESLPKQQETSSEVAASQPQQTQQQPQQPTQAQFDELGVRVDKSQYTTDSFQAESDLARKRFDKEVSTTIGDSFKAAVASFDTVGFFKESFRRSRIQANEAGLYEPDPDFDIKEAIKSSPIPLSKDEVNWLNDKKFITSQRAFDLYIDGISEEREQLETASIHGVTSFATSMLDPVYLVAGMGAGKAVQLAKVGTFGAVATVASSEAATAFANTYHRTVDTSEVVLAATIPAVITAGVWRKIRGNQELNGKSHVSYSEEIGSGKLSEPTFDPTTGEVLVKTSAKETVDYISNIDAVQASRNSSLTGKPSKLYEPTVKLADDGTVVPYKLNEHGFPRSSEINWKQTNSKGTPLDTTAYRRVYDIIEDTRIPKAVREDAARLLKQGGKELGEVEFKSVKSMREVGRYYPRKNTIKVRKSQAAASTDAARTFNHEAAHSLTALRVAFGKMYPDSVHGKLVKDIEDLKGRVEKIYRERRKEFTAREQQEIAYSLQNTDEFLASLYEGNTAFRKLMEEVPTRADKFGNERTLMQSLFTGLRRLLGMSVEDANAYVKALKLSDDLIDTPKVHFQDVDGNVKEVLASEVTPELVMQEALKDGEKAFQSVVDKGKSYLSLAIFDSFERVMPGWAKPILSSPAAGQMQSNVVSTKRALQARLDIHNTDAESIFRLEAMNRGVTTFEYASGSGKYTEVAKQLESEIAHYIEVRSQAHKQGVVLPRGEGNVADIAEHYRNMTHLARDEGIRTGAFGENVAKVDWYMPRKIDSEKFMQVFDRFKNIYGEEHATTKFVDYLAKTIQMENAPPEYKRHIAYVYYRRMLDRYHNVDSFSGNLGNDVLHAVDGYLDHIGVTDHTTRQHIKDAITGGLDERGKATFQRFRLDIDTLSEHHLPDGSTFKFYDLMDTGVLDAYRRYADNVSGRVGLAEQGLSTATEWRKYRDTFLNHPSLQGEKNRAKRKTYADIIDDTYNLILGYPVGEALRPFLIGARAATNAVALKFSGLLQPMEIVPIVKRHAKANGYLKAFGVAVTSLFKSTKTLEKTRAGELSTVLMRASMDDLKQSPLSPRMSDNHIMDTASGAAKLAQLSKLTYVVNGMRYLMGKQAIASAELISDNVKQAAKGDVRAITLLKKHGFTDADVAAMKTQVDAHGTKFDNWDAGTKGDVFPKLMNLMDVDVLRSRLGEIPAWMQFSTVGKVLGTFRNYVFTAHSKIFASTIRDEGILAAALIGAYQFPLAVLSIQAASIARGDGIIEDPEEMLKRAFANLGVWGIMPEIGGVLTGETRNFNSAALMSLDSLLGVANSVGKAAGNAIRGEGSASDVGDIAQRAAGAIPVVSVTLGFQLGVKAVIEAMADN